MLIPVGGRIRRSVLIVRATPSPLLLPAELTLFDGRHYHVELGRSSSGLSPGDRVVLDLGNSGSARQRVLVEKLEGTGAVLLMVGPLRGRERREWPRIHTRLKFDYRPLPASWIGLDLDVFRDFPLVEVMGDRSSLDQDVDISVSGMRFWEVTPREVGDLLLLGLEISAPPVSVLGEVVRVDPEPSGGYHIAVAFLDLAAPIIHTLSAFMEFHQPDSTANSPLAPLDLD